MRNYLIGLREQRNESQQDVADAIRVSRQYYAMIERGERQKKMDITVMSALATHFNIPLAEFIGLERGSESGD